MPIINKNDNDREEVYPGTQRRALVDAAKGAQSLSVADLTLAPGAAVANHTHPTEEAMVIMDGELEAVLGDEVATVTSGDTVLAPPGVKHGFVNRSGASARLMAIFPTTTVERTLVD